MRTVPGVTISSTQASHAAARWLSALGADGIDVGEVRADGELWRVELVVRRVRIGEAVVSSRSGQVDGRRSTTRTLIVERAAAARASGGVALAHDGYVKLPTRFHAVHGPAVDAFAALPPGCVDLVVGTPPVWDPASTPYAEYLAGIRTSLRAAVRLLADGRFVVVVVAPVLVPRADRNSASRRVPVPFDVQGILEHEDLEYVDTVVWEKPAGAGWASGRGRRFAADRTPLQYKPVPVTEDVLIYRKSSGRLLDWNIRTYPDQDAVRRSRVGDGYEQTNVWRLSATTDPRHDRVLPEALVERIVRYYSFETDTVCGPWAALGTTGKVALTTGRGFVLCEADARLYGELTGDLLAGRWSGLLGVEPTFACAVDGCASAACRALG